MKITVKEAMEIIKAAWQYLPSVEKINVNEHIMWDIIIPGYTENDDLDEDTWEDILAHIALYLPDSDTK